MWPRGGAKSSTIELAIAFLATRKPLQRKFVLYVSGTQDQADLHVKAISSLLESAGVGRAVGKYGSSKGWRRNQLITADGFAVAAYGLDNAIRGIKIEEFRPDLIVFDDVDSQDDTPETVTKKTDAITTAILPAGSADQAILFLQNLVHENGVIAQLVDGRADFLYDREVPEPIPAVRGLQTETFVFENGRSGYKIIAGEATWTGQSIEVCEKQINDWGLRAFLREAQHEVEGTAGYYFDHKRLEIVQEHPELIKVSRAWDLAATEGGGDYTAGVLMGTAKNKVKYIPDVIRDQMSSERVERTILVTADADKKAYGKVTIVLPQDPGQAGKSQAIRLRTLLQKAGHHVVIVPVTGKKAVRARGLAADINSGNVKLIKGAWNSEFITEAKDFREDEKHLFDDQIDAGADAHNELEGKRKIEAILV